MTQSEAMARQRGNMCVLNKIHDLFSRSFLWPRIYYPSVKGPRPRVLSSEAKAALKRAQRETDVVNNISIKHVDSEMGV